MRSYLSVAICGDKSPTLALTSLARQRSLIHLLRPPAIRCGRFLISRGPIAGVVWVPYTLRAGSDPSRVAPPYLKPRVSRCFDPPTATPARENVDGHPCPRVPSPSHDAPPNAAGLLYGTPDAPYSGHFRGDREHRGSGSMPLELQKTPAVMRGREPIERPAPPFPEGAPPYPLPLRRVNHGQEHPRPFIAGALFHPRPPRLLPAFPFLP